MTWYSSFRGLCIVSAASFILLPLAPTRLMAGPRTEDLAFEGGGGFRLAGTVTLPDSARFAAPFPGVLLLPGSGPTDRDGNQLPDIRTDLLAQLARGLADAG